MSKATYLDYLKSKKWKSIRIKLFEMRGHRCELCGGNKVIQVHHIDYIRIGNERPFDLVVLCKDCHEKAHLDKLGNRLQLNKRSLLTRLFELGFKPQKTIYRFPGLKYKIRGLKHKESKKTVARIERRDPYKIKIKKHNPPIVRLSVLEKWALKDHPKIRFKIK